jgi:hypothetical protein
VLLDCDIGKNSCLDGCVSLTFQEASQKIWIGELTPLNNLQTYLRAIRYLYALYRRNYFGKKLIINTMGYTTGLGEFLLYEIFEIVKPLNVLVLRQPQSGNDMKTIVSNLNSGHYIQKLHLSPAQEERHASSTSILYYDNNRASSKKGTTRFEKIFEVGNRTVGHLCDLLELIRHSQCPFSPDRLHFKTRKEVSIYEQSKHQKAVLDGTEAVHYRFLDEDECVDMRLIVLGTMLQEEQLEGVLVSNNQTKSSGLFDVQGLGFCFQGQIYSTTPI